MSHAPLRISRTTVHLVGLVALVVMLLALSACSTHSYRDYEHKGGTYLLNENAVKEQFETCKSSYELDSTKYSMAGEGPLSKDCWTQRCMEANGMVPTPGHDYCNPDANK